MDVLRERSLNKKLKTIHLSNDVHSERSMESSDRMMVDHDDALSNEVKEDVIPKPNQVDEEGDVSMEKGSLQTRPVQTSSIRKEHKDTLSAVVATCFGGVFGSRRRNKDRFPVNRVPRSGLDFCVQCGVGA